MKEMENYTELLRGVQLLQIEMLKEFIHICSELGLKYFVLGGTMLGAIRHKGFIPWDDDIDVGMPRKDYEVFVNNAHAKMSNSLFLQTKESDPNMTSLFTKIRLNGSVLKQKISSGIDMHHGIFIDIFPLDNASICQKQNLHIFKKLRSNSFRRSGALNIDYNWKGRIITKLKLMTNLHSNYFYTKKAQALIQKFNSTETGYIANYFGCYKEKEIFCNSVFGDGKKYIFEGVEVIGPIKYDEYLSQLYGDYMTLPPKEKRINLHHPVEIKLCEYSFDSINRKNLIN